MDQSSQSNNEQNQPFISARLAEQGLKVLHEFAAAISFQIRTPLMAIIGYSDLILSNKTGPLTEKQKDSLAYLHRSADDLLHLVDEIKKFQKQPLPSAKKQSDYLVLFTSDIRNLQYFLSGIVHKTHAPLTAIIASSTFLLSSPNISPLNEIQRKYLTSIRAIGGQLLELVNELLDVYYLSFRWFEVTLEEIDVNQLIQESISATLEHWIVGKRSVKPAITSNLADNLPPIWADSRAIQQAISQILLETIRAIPDDEPAEILLMVNQVNYRITFRVSIQDQRKNLFFDDHNPRIFFSRCIIEMHRGQLRLEKQGEFESAVTFSLPADPNRRRN